MNSRTPDQKSQDSPAAPPGVACSDLLGRISITHEVDCNLYLLPTIGLNLHKLEDYSRDFEREVMKEIVTHQLWVRLLFWKYQRTICINLNIERINKCKS